MIKVIAFLCVLSIHSNGDSIINKSKLLGSDYRLFQNTPAWNLARGVKSGNSDLILEIGKKNPELIDYPDPIYGQTLLSMAVYNKCLNSVKALLTTGANPNKQSSQDGVSALMVSAQVGGSDADTQYLKLLLKYGGNPNALQHQAKINNVGINHFTPLIYACYFSLFDNVKILIKAGADVNKGEVFGFTPLYAAIVARNPDIVYYLLQKGASFNQPMYITVKGERKYILDALQQWNFQNDSVKLWTKAKIIDFLKINGVH